MAATSKEFIVKIGKKGVPIERRVFLELLRASPAEDYAPYKRAFEANEISFSDLKELANRANVPFPLFFAPMAVVWAQIADNERNLFDKLPSKEEMQLTSRGGLRLKDIELVAKDLGRKQRFMNAYLMPGAPLNPFIGMAAKHLKAGASAREIASELRGYLGIDLREMRRGSKADCFQYLAQKAEARNILVSRSSYNFMPQRIPPDAGFSGICFKDKKFPYIFIHTRDGEEKPLILESEGRQSFTLCAMLVCIALNKFVFNTKRGQGKDGSLHTVYAIAGELLLPDDDLEGLEISYYEDLKRAAKTFKITPSMLLQRLINLKLIDPALHKSFKKELLQELEDMKPKRLRTPLPTTGYGKYNGERFSREVVRAHDQKRISFDAVKNILFRKSKMENGLYDAYKKVYGFYG